MASWAEVSQYLLHASRMRFWSLTAVASLKRATAPLQVQPFQSSTQVVPCRKRVHFDPSMKSWIFAKSLLNGPILPTFPRTEANHADGCDVWTRSTFQGATVPEWFFMPSLFAAVSRRSGVFRRRCPPLRMWWHTFVACRKQIVPVVTRRAPATLGIEKGHGKIQETFGFRI